MSGAIGPHEGRELELMLRGEKRLSYFPELDPADEFEPYVQAGRIVRYIWYEKKSIMREAGYPAALVRVVPEAVVYHFPGEEELRDELLECLRQSFLVAPTSERLLAEERIGLLLGYSEEDVAVFLAQARLRATS